MAFCTRCGGQLVVGGAFCGNCGSAVNPQPLANPSPMAYTVAPQPLPQVQSQWQGRSTGRARTGRNGGGLEVAAGVLALVGAVVLFAALPVPYFKFSGSNSLLDITWGAAMPFGAVGLVALGVLALGTGTAALVPASRRVGAAFLAGFFPLLVAWVLTLAAAGTSSSSGEEVSALSAGAWTARVAAVTLLVGSALGLASIIRPGMTMRGRHVTLLVIGMFVALLLALFTFWNPFTFFGQSSTISDNTEWSLTWPWWVGQGLGTLALLGVVACTRDRVRQIAGALGFGTTWILAAINWLLVLDDYGNSRYGLNWSAWAELVMAVVVVVAFVIIASLADPPRRAMKQSFG